MTFFSGNMTYNLIKYVQGKDSDIYDFSVKTCYVLIN